MDSPLDERKEALTLLAWQAHRGVELSVARLRALPAGKFRGQDSGWVDAGLLIISLWRLRSAAAASTELSSAGPTSDAVSKFDAVLPGLQKLRNVTMHFENYALGNDKRRNTVDGEGTFIGTHDLWALEANSARVDWLGETLEYASVLTAARDLYDAVQVANKRPSV